MISREEEMSVCSIPLPPPPLSEKKVLLDVSSLSALVPPIILLLLPWEILFLRPHGLTFQARGKKEEEAGDGFLQRKEGFFKKNLDTVETYLIR